MSTCERRPQPVSGLGLLARDTNAGPVDPEPISCAGVGAPKASDRGRVGLDTARDRGRAGTRSLGSAGYRALRARVSTSAAGNTALRGTGRVWDGPPRPSV